MTLRQNIWFGVFCAACIAATGLIGAYWFWVEDSIRSQMDGAGAEVINIEVLSFRCSPQYFWGHDVLLDRPDGVRVWRHVCRNWTEKIWFSFPVGEEPPDHYFIANQPRHRAAMRLANSPAATVTVPAFVLNKKVELLIPMMGETE